MVGHADKAAGAAMRRRADVADGFGLFSQLPGFHFPSIHPCQRCASAALGYAGRGVIDVDPGGVVIPICCECLSFTGALREYSQMLGGFILSKLCVDDALAQ